MVQMDPMWEKARRLLAEGRRVAAEFAREIERLREVYLDEGKRRSLQNLKKGDLPKFTNVNFGDTNDLGFVAQLREQLGLHPEQARRLLAEVDYQRRIEAVAEMEPGSWIEAPGKGRGAEPVEIEITPRMIELAREALEARGAPGCPKASRQWAGIAGEGYRVDSRQEGATERAPTNHFVNIAAAIAKLKNSLRPQVMNELPADQFAELEKMWRDMAPLIPERWR